MEDQEKKNRRAGLFWSTGVHALMAIALFFIVAWRAPDPPLPEYGIELNFGLDNQGSGDVQPDKPVGDQGETTTTEEAQQPSTNTAEEAPVTDNSVKEEAVEAVSKTESPVSAKESKTVPEPSKDPAKTEKQAVTKTNTQTPAKETPKDANAEAAKQGEATSQGDDTKKTGDKGSEQGKLDAQES